MFNVIKTKAFDDSIDPSDPIHSIPIALMEESANMLATQVDVFVRQCMAKILSPDSLAIFIDTRSAVPGLDLNMELLSYNTRRMTVTFKEKEIGHATFTTKFEKEDSIITIKHLVSDLVIL